MVIAKILLTKEIPKSGKFNIRVYYGVPGGITITQKFYMWKDGYLDIPFTMINNNMSGLSNLTNCYFHGQRVVMTTSSFYLKFYGKKAKYVPGETLIHKIVC